MINQIKLSTRTALGYISILLMFPMSGCSHDPAANNTAAPPVVPTVSVATATIGTITQTAEVTGTLGPLPDEEVTIVPQVPGTLTLLDAQLGRPVAVGQVIAQISPILLMGQIQQAQATLSQDEVQVQQAEANFLQQKANTRASILQADASVRSAEAALESAKATLTGDLAALSNTQSTLDRQKQLFGDGLVAQKDVESSNLDVQTAQAIVDAQRQTISAQSETVAGQAQAVDAAKAQAMQDDVKRSDIDVARAQVVSAKGALDALNAQLALYTIRAPISGYPTLIGGSVGSTVDTTTKLITITNTQVMQLTLGVPTEVAASLKPGQYVTFMSASIPGKSFTTQIQSISNQVDSTSGTVQTISTVQNPNGLLKDDMTVSAQIITNRRVGVVVVPESALNVDADSGGTSVDTVDKSGVLHVAAVKVGLKAGGNVEIVSGISDGTVVATAGQFGLADGTQVHVSTDASSQ